MVLKRHSLIQSISATGSRTGWFIASIFMGIPSRTCAQSLFHVPRQFNDDVPIVPLQECLVALQAVSNAERWKQTESRGCPRLPEIPGISSNRPANPNICRIDSD